jgi:imidazoleglycerol phosphate synthase glutamine amidotransferase subunit HisH
MKITIVDYGVGNIFSVGQALKSLGLNFSLDADGSSISHSDLVIVPGVAAFGIGMKNMVDRTHESDGTIEIKSEKDKGTQVLVVVPLEHKTIKV